MSAKEMSQREKLDAERRIHLGNLLLRGEEQKASPVAPEVDSFSTHCFITGMTGSGKTGVGFNIIEDTIRSGVPVVLFDIKGDLLNIVNTRSNTLGKELSAKMAVRCLTPGSLHGEPVNLLAGLNDPEDVSNAVTALLKLCGIESDVIQSNEHTFISQILRQRHARKQSITLPDLISLVMTPEFETLGAMPLEVVLPPNKRMKLAAHINRVMSDPDFEPWRSGVALDYEQLLARRDDDRVPVIVVQFSHIVDDDKREFALTVAFEALLKYMRESNGSSKLRLMAFVDEVQGLIPPAPSKPSTKLPLLTLLKQARAFGIGLVLATQNPFDIDYKGMGNMGTWVVGQLKTANDRQRVLEGIKDTGAWDTYQLSKIITSLAPRQFLLCRNDQPIIFKSRDINIQQAGPVNLFSIDKLYRQGKLVSMDKASILISRLAEARALLRYNPRVAGQVRQLEMELAKLGHDEFLADSPVDDLDDVEDEEPLRTEPRRPVVEDEEELDKEKEQNNELDEAESELREQFAQLSYTKLVNEVVSRKIHPTKAAAQLYSTGALIDSIVQHELGALAVDQVLRGR